jgi:hypothetical protein
MPAASVTVKRTTGGLETLTLWTVTFGASAAQAAEAASVGVSALLGMVMRVTPGPPAPASPGGPGGPAAPGRPYSPGPGRGRRWSLLLPPRERALS